MKIYFNPESGGFIHQALWGKRELPSGCIEISESEYLALQNCVLGKQQIDMQDGRPVLVDLPEYVPTYDELLAEAHAQRRAAYVAESDPIKNEADYDALTHGTAPDYTAWIAAVEAIKARYPLPA